jgi:hypothetical protein
VIARLGQPVRRSALPYVLNHLEKIMYSSGLDHRDSNKKLLGTWSDSPFLFCHFAQDSRPLSPASPRLGGEPLGFCLFLISVIRVHQW